MCGLTGQTHSDKLTGISRSAYHGFIVDGSSLFGMFITESKGRVSQIARIKSLSVVTRDSIAVMTFMVMRRCYQAINEQ